MNGKEVRFIELFAGVGGFHKGFQQAGNFKCVWANEWDKHASTIYRKNFPETPFHEGDVRLVKADDIPEADLLCAGFPCQPFSLAGKRQGFEEARGTLFYEILRIARGKRIPFILLENVKGLLSAQEGEAFRFIVTSLVELGYCLQWQVLNSKDFGVPQNRERVFIVGCLGEKRFRQIFPIKAQYGKIAGTSGEAQGSGKRVCPTVYTKSHRGDATYIIEGEKAMIELTGNMPDAQRIYSTKGIAKTLKGRGGGQGAKTGLYAIPCLTPNRPEKRQNGRRFKEEGEPMFTLTGQDVHEIATNNKIRRLTPVECERLQGFPDGWTEGLSDTQRYKCMGNAVTVNVIEAIGQKILENLK